MNNPTPTTTPPAFGPVAMAMSGCTIQFTYRNWRGEISERTAERMSIWFGSTEQHIKQQWLMSADDVDHGKRRCFAMRNMSNVRMETA